MQVHKCKYNALLNAKPGGQKKISRHFQTLIIFFSKSSNVNCLTKIFSLKPNKLTSKKNVSCTKCVIFISPRDDSKSPNPRSVACTYWHWTKSNDKKQIVHQHLKSNLRYIPTTFKLHRATSNHHENNTPVYWTLLFI